MKLSIYQVDAFTNEIFKGNPAAVIPLDNWLPDPLLQSIALENNLSETAFFVGEPGEYHIRWFTPESEVDLCGHATLASAHVLYTHIGIHDLEINFHSRSGKLSAIREKHGLIGLDFPAQQAEEMEDMKRYQEIFGRVPLKVFSSGYDMVLFENEEVINQLEPDFQKLKKLNKVGVIVTAKGNTYDFVSRFFAPKVGIEEDPVTGSAHTILVPYWAKILNKNKLKAYQSSERGGILYCEYLDGRVKIAGEAVTYMVGEIYI